MTYILSGANEVTWEQLKSIPTPKAKGRWHPVTHKTVASHIIGLTQQRGHTINEIRYGIDKYNDMFGYMRLNNTSAIGNNADSVQQVVGFRNSHNKRFSVSAVAGSQVMVCSNLQFRGEHGMRRKHTTHVMRDLGNRINDMLNDAFGEWEDTVKSYTKYSLTPLSSKDADHLIMRSAKAGAINPSDVLKVEHEFYNPTHDDFADHNAWSLFNATTEILKRVPTQLQQKTIKLHKVYDEFCTA
jgi:hypothetical protein